MMKALYTAATGMKGQQMTVDVISNNIANVNTSGFKKSRVNFQDLLYVRLQKPGDAALAIQSPTGLEIGSGVRAVSTTRVFTPGVLEGTQRDLDVAIQGNGFFAVQLPDGSLGYTREGSLHVDSQLNLVTSQGYRLDPQMKGGIGGTGLGLYICRELVRRMQGRIWVEPRRGGGSCFFVELPAAGRTTAGRRKTAANAAG